MNSYDFESKDGKWSLDFPNDGMAIAHGKQNGAFKVSLFGNKIAGLEDIGNGFKAWKVCNQAMQNIMLENQCPNCD